MHLFEKATKHKFRYPSSKGELSTEQLWDLPLRSRTTNGLCLNTVAKDVNEAIKAFGEEDFVGTGPEPGKQLALDKLEVVKFIIEAKKAELDQRKRAQENEMRKQRIRELLATKDNEADMSKSREELEKELKDLES